MRRIHESIDSTQIVIDQGKLPSGREVTYGKLVVDYKQAFDVFQVLLGGTTEKFDELLKADEPIIIKDDDYAVRFIPKTEDVITLQIISTQKNNAEDSSDVNIFDKIVDKFIKTYNDRVDLLNLELEVASDQAKEDELYQMSAETDEEEKPNDDIVKGETETDETEKSDKTEDRADTNSQDDDSIKDEVEPDDATGEAEPDEDDTDSEDEIDLLFPDIDDLDSEMRTDTNDETDDIEILADETDETDASDVSDESDKISDEVDGSTTEDDELKDQIPFELDDEQESDVDRDLDNTDEPEVSIKDTLNKEVRSILIKILELDTLTDVTYDLATLLDDSILIRIYTSRLAQWKHLKELLSDISFQRALSYELSQITNEERDLYIKDTTENMISLIYKLADDQDTIDGLPLTGSDDTDTDSDSDSDEFAEINIDDMEDATDQDELDVQDETSKYEIQSQYDKTGDVKAAIISELQQIIEVEDQDDYKIQVHFDVDPQYGLGVVVTATINGSEAAFHADIKDSAFKYQLEYIFNKYASASGKLLYINAEGTKNVSQIVWLIPGILNQKATSKSATADEIVKPETSATQEAFSYNLKSTGPIGQIDSNQSLQTRFERVQNIIESSIVKLLGLSISSDILCDTYVQGNKVIVDLGFDDISLKNEIEEKMFDVNVTSVIKTLMSNQLGIRGTLSIDYSNETAIYIVYTTK